MTYDFDNIETRLENGAFFLTINRPESRNSLDAQTLKELDNAFTEVDNNNQIQVVILQGAGDKVFASGADIKQLHDRRPLENLSPGMQGLYDKIENCSKVTVAAVNGFALGGGCEPALACDIRIATERAKFGLPELNLGIMPGAGGTQRLSRTIGVGRAIDMILTGKIIDGEKANQIGLVTYYVNQEDLENQIDEIINNVKKKGPIAVSLVKKAVYKGFDIDRDAAMWIEKLSQAVLFNTEDKEEGTLAFLEKRDANFKNK